MIQLEDAISDDWSEGDKDMMRSLAQNGPAVLHGDDLWWSAFYLAFPEGHQLSFKSGRFILTMSVDETAQMIDEIFWHGDASDISLSWTQYGWNIHIDTSGEETKSIIREYGSKVSR